uniref:Alternative protein EML5 n=1 Tax=Homo sapiens TaxID=9606 RepID=L8EBH5_HUMAN|nr:alternative protein EML5 [Homo sapiens]
MELTLLLDAMTARLIFMELLSVIKKLASVWDPLVSSLIWTGLQTVDICRQMMEMGKDFFIECQEERK